jgi:GNAT superfamily N-acetyltransferase
MLSAPQTWSRGEYEISTDPARLDLDTAHDFIAVHSYWARGIPRSTFERALANSLTFGVYRGTQQVGLARVVTDYASFGYLADVFIAESERGQGLSKWLMDCLLSHPGLQGLRRMMLATLDAHGLYQQYGFTPLAAPERFLERHNPNIYTQPTP